MTSEASPTGMPRSIAKNSRPNCPTPTNKPYSATIPIGARGALTNRMAGKAAKTKRSAVSVKGGASRTPILIAMKASPRASAATIAARMSRGFMEDSGAR